MDTTLATFQSQQTEPFSAEFATLIDALAQVRQQQRTFGDTEGLRNERSRIIYRLNEICLAHLNTTFNELKQQNGWDV